MTPVLWLQPDVPPLLARVPVALEGAACAGDEASLLDCPAASLSAVAEGCRHPHDVYVVCYAGADQGAQLRQRHLSHSVHVIASS